MSWRVLAMYAFGLLSVLAVLVLILLLVGWIQEKRRFDKQRREIDAYFRKVWKVTDSELKDLWKDKK